MFTKKKNTYKEEKRPYLPLCDDWWKKKHAWQYDMGAWGWGYSVIQID